MAENGNVKPTIAGIAALLFLLTAVWALVNNYQAPVAEDVETAQNDIVEVEKDLKVHDEKTGHSGVLTMLASMEKQFEGNQTELTGFRDIYNISQQRDMARLTKAESRLLKLESDMRSLMITTAKLEKTLVPCVFCMMRSSN